MFSNTLRVEIFQKTDTLKFIFINGLYKVPRNGIFSAILNVSFKYTMGHIKGLTLNSIFAITLPIPSL